MGIGGGKGSSQSSGSSEGFGYGYNAGASQGMGGSQQDVWGPQGEALQNLYARADQTFDRTQGQGIPGAQRAQNMAFGAGNALNQFTRPNNRLASQQVNMAQRDIGRAFNQQVLPGLTSSAIASGGLGGSRGSIAAGLAGQEALRQMGDVSVGLRSNAYNQAAQAASQQGALRLGGAQAGFNMGMGMQAAPWQALQAYSGILGGPTVLGQSFNQTSGWNYGENFKTQAARDQSTSEKFNFGFNF